MSSCQKKLIRLQGNIHLVFRIAALWTTLVKISVYLSCNPDLATAPGFDDFRKPPQNEDYLNTSGEIKKIMTFLVATNVDAS